MSSTSLLCLLSLVACVSAQCATGVNDGVDNCKTEPRLVHINCMKDSPCTCSDSTGEQESLGSCSDYYQTAEDLENLINYEEADGKKCEELCKAIWDDEGVELANKCQYYKFLEVPNYLPDEGRNCYFMSSEQCLEEAGLPCDSYCQSGQIDCGDTDVTTATPDPSDTSCPVNMPELVQGNIHWRCTNGEIEVTPYGDKVNGLPLGTVCTSIHPCYQYPNSEENATDYKLSFKCEEPGTVTTTVPNTTQEGTTAEPETTADPATTQQPRVNPKLRAGSRDLNDGEWVSQTQEKYTGDQTIFSEGALTDPACAARSLLLDPDNYHQDGLILQCTNSQVDTTGPGPVINAPNICFLFCNFYSVMKIDTKWRDDYGQGEQIVGEKVWRYVISGTEEEHIFPQDSDNAEFQSAKEEVKCWGR